jgi:DNA repair ATPase RecN
MTTLEKELPDLLAELRQKDPETYAKIEPELAELGSLLRAYLNNVEEGAAFARKLLDKMVSIRGVLEAVQQDVNTLTAEITTTLEQIDQTSTDLKDTLRPTPPDIKLQ